MKTKLRLVSTQGHSVTVTRTSTVLSPFGPVRAGLTTSPRTSRDLVLMELLNCLEKKVAELNFKSLEVLDTLEQGTKAMRAEPLDSIIATTGTEML